MIYDLVGVKLKRGLQFVAFVEKESCFNMLINMPKMAYYIMKVKVFVINIDPSI